MCSQVPLDPALRLAPMEQHGLSIDHKLHRSAVSFKLLAALQSLCLPEADLSALFQKWEAGKMDIRLRPTPDVLSVEAQQMLKNNLQHLLKQYTSVEAACGSSTAETSLVRRYVQSQLTILTSNLAGLCRSSVPFYCISCSEPLQRASAS